MQHENPPSLSTMLKCAGRFCFYGYMATRIPFIKTYSTPHELVQLLKTRGMEITDEEKAQHYLSHIGYYRLSAYTRRDVGRDTYSLPKKNAAAPRCHVNGHGTTKLHPRCHVNGHGSTKLRPWCRKWTAPTSGPRRSNIFILLHPPSNAADEQIKKGRLLMRQSPCSL